MKRLIYLSGVMAIAFGFAACASNNMNGNANANVAVIQPTPAVTPTPANARGQYSEEQARAERARAKESKETIGDTLDDAWIHTKIVAKLLSDSKTPERKINVDVVNGMVTLRGTVDTAEAKTEAERQAKDTDGVKSVTNQLKVAPAPAKSPAATKSPKKVG
jgi:hypothetical protein